jgi:hypothetical protein
MNSEMKQEDLDRIKFLEDNIKTMRQELNKLKSKKNIINDCNIKRERYKNDPEFRKERIEKSKLYYRNKIKPIMEAAKQKSIE